MARSADRVEVLVVDDERVIREGLTRKLVSAGFDVRLASDGRAAVQAFLLERPDLVLLDVMMPGMDGYATYGCISADSGRNCRVARRSKPSGGEATRLSHCNDIVTKGCL